jgi:cytochrome c oxidase assembly protein subunit 19
MASSGGAFGGARGYQPKPPEKGVFPLDHFGECTHVKDAYLTCLQKNQAATDNCKELAKAYLECRMKRSLMAEQDLSELGFDDANTTTTSSTTQSKSMTQ